jgi:serine/threonine protein kinase
MIGAPAIAKSKALYPGYRLRDLRCRTGSAEVWEADDDGGETVALKFRPCADSQSAARRIRSIQTVRQLDHPLLTRVHRVWCGPGCLVIATELAEGSLLDLLTAYRTELGTPISPEHVCHLLAQAAEVLDFLNTPHHHVCGRRVAVQHRAVKPSNLLVVEDQVKLADFGFAVVPHSSAEASHPLPPSPYLAPEVLQGRVSDWLDQYALAVTYCLLRGNRLPFPEAPAAAEGDGERPPPDLSMLSRDEQPIIRRALALMPYQRWPSCRELIAQLERVIL